MAKRTAIALSGVVILAGALAFALAQNRSFPTPINEEGQPIESRAPEKPDDRPAFPGQTRAPYRASVPYRVTTVSNMLSAPWSLAFLPNGKFLITEKLTGDVRIVGADGTLSAPLSGVPAVAARGQVGLLDIVLDPRFSENRRVFFSYSEPRPNGETNIAIARAALDEAGLSLQNVSVIFRALPAQSGHGANQGGRLLFGRDGMLYATIGDRSSSPPWDVAQRLNTHLGKIIRITTDGAPASGNPFIGTPGALPEIWSIGHRSEQGLALDPQGRLWETEHGPRGGDELNLVQAGKNYGWPVIVHGIDYPGTTIGEGITEKEGMVQPVYYWDPVIAPSGLAFYDGDLFPAWKNSVFVGALRGTMLDRLELDGDRVVAEEPLLVDLGKRIRDVRVGPDGAVYVLTDEQSNASLLKITPSAP